ncbi:MAG: hypothetical protein Q3974_00995, partial [Rothia sp. (in: high G+C Gram-positive bacteria)]|nr:hypothetical protein [Rothia sp. (in: high G+C Gram-positive bacteria)]
SDSKGEGAKETLFFFIKTKKMCFLKPRGGETFTTPPAPVAISVYQPAFICAGLPIPLWQ